MIKAGIIDPSKVVRTALQDATLNGTEQTSPTLMRSTCEPTSTTSPVFVAHLHPGRSGEPSAIDVQVAPADLS
jgi:hypothetical protein